MPHRRDRICNYLMVITLMLSLSGCGLFLPDDEATWVLKDLAAADEASYLKQITCPPYREVVSYQVDGEQYEADLYTPGKAPLAAIVLSPGLAEAGKNDSRLVSFAHTLARARFMVLIPDLANLRQLKVRRQDVQGLMDAFEYLRNRSGLKKDTPAGVGGFSYMAGPAVLAALGYPRPEQVDFVLSVGGYYDLNQVVRYFTTGYFRENGEWQHKEPNHYGKWAFVMSNADLLDSEQDQQTLTRIAKRKLAQADADIEDLRSKLSAQGKAVLALIDNKQRERSDDLLASLPAAMKEQLAMLNLANKDLSALEAELLLVHGTDDSIIPYTQSQALDSSLPENQAQLFLIDGLAHVDLQPLQLDQQAAWRAIHALLSFRNPVAQSSSGCTENTLDDHHQGDNSN
ncbi:hypothetical protein [Methylophaga sp.]|uniref:hypothetical protein n=1 Tax=Methylophaga sp. TaxID=2024840 RepID=UPI0014007CEE|nr:hypothetical protein [Methylophaga sp.]MTI63892.1 alpha/beta hydrolase [Methylophaga sp.]